MTKRELHEGLKRLPLGVQPNRLAVALTLTGQSLTDVMIGTGIHLSTVSHIANGQRQPTPDQQKALAKYFGTTVSVLFPDVRQEVA